jgi:hypothetical protein
MSKLELLLIFGWLIVWTTALAGAVFVLIRRQLITIESKFGPVKPLWQHVQSELFAIMRHPHGWAQEMDELMTEAEQEPEVHMTPERYARFMELCAEKVASSNPELRANERAAAASYLAIIPLIRGEEQNPVDLTGIRLIGSQAPEAETAEDMQTRTSASN